MQMQQYFLFGSYQDGRQDSKTKLFAVGYSVVFCLSL
jgi:hypothetical protein